ncbi:hypothetical protein HRG_001744 [Hirsutella rhossiliensis]
MGDAADETETDEPDDLPEPRGPARAKLAVFRAFCTVFNQTAAQFTSAQALNFAKDFSRGFLSYWDDALNGAPTRWDTPLDLVAKTLNLGAERRPQVARDSWAARLGAVAVEGFQKWHIYAVADCPRQLTDIWGAVVDYDQAIKEEIRLQTGGEPIDVHVAKRYAESSDQPTVTMVVSFEAPIQRRWRHFGTSRLARLIAKNPQPAQCDNCWHFHSRATHATENRPADDAAGKTTAITSVSTRRGPGARTANSRGSRRSKRPTPSPCARAAETRLGTQQDQQQQQCQPQRLPPPTRPPAPDFTTLLLPQHETVVAADSAESPKKRRRQNARLKPYE